MLYVAITKDRGPGYHVQLRSRLAATVPDMQSRKCRSESEATRDAERLFGQLNWTSGAEAGLDNQPYVRAIACIETAPA